MASVREMLADPGARLTASQRRILAAVDAAGGAALRVTSLGRAGSTEGYHAQGRAVDFGTEGNPLLLPLLFLTAARLRAQGWKGGLGLGHPPAALHLHLDDRPAPFYFVELSRTRPVQVARLTDDWLENLRRVYGAPVESGGVLVLGLVVCVLVAGVWYIRRMNNPGVMQ